MDDCFDCCMLALSFTSVAGDLDTGGDGEDLVDDIG